MDLTWNDVAIFDKKVDQFVVDQFTGYFGNESSIYYWLHQYWEETADPRTKDYFLVGISPVGFTTLVIGFYLATVFVVIPEYMRKKRHGLEVRKAMIIYNFILVLINAYFFFKTLFGVTRFGREMWNFTNPKTDTSEQAMEFIRVSHLYYLSKIVDFFDTFFMALKKKHSQITFLHLWHHVSMVSAGWLYMKYNPYMPTAAIVPIVNGFIHVLMYSYYGLSALGPEWQKYLWWKKYMTQMQLIQFIIVFSWYILVFFKQTDLPWGYLACMLGNAAFLFTLFLNFYLKSYSKQKRQQIKENINNNKCNEKID